MSTIRANSITNSAGSGAPDFPNGLTVEGAPLAGGTQTFTATGSISTGQLVGLNPDGTVSVVAPYSGSEAVFESATTIEISAAYDSVNAKVVVVYSDVGNSYYRTAVVGTVSGTSISFGTPVVFYSGSTNFSGTACVFHPVSGKVVIAYTDVSAQGTAIVGTVSGTSISFGSPTTFETSTTDGMSCAYDSVNNKVVISYRDAGVGAAIVGTVSGTSISFGSSVVFRNAGIINTSCVYATTSGKIVIFYRDDGNSSFGTAIVGTVSGTSISFGTAVVFNSAYTWVSFRGAVYDSIADKVVMTYINTGVTPSVAVAIVGTVSGTSISFGTPVTFLSQNNWPINELCCCFDPATGYITALVVNGPSINAYYNTFVRLKVSGTTVLSGTPINQTYNTSQPAIVTAGSVSVAAYQARANSMFGTAQAVNMASTLPNWVGIAAESISTGNDGKVTVIGGIAGGLSALSPGTRYGISTSTGALTAFNSLTTTNYIGTAVSPTELYISVGRV